MTQPARDVSLLVNAREDEIRERCDRGDVDGATTLAIKLHGRELFQFLLHTHRDERAASDVFALACEDTWRGLPTFRWSSTLRAWMYSVARNASHELRRAERRHGRSVATSPDERVFAEVAEQVRTETLRYLRTESRSALDRLRDELSVDERMLLSLRIDRGLSWPDIAAAYAREDADEPDPQRRAARLRKRFQLLKDRLRRRARELGILPSGDEPR